MKISPLSPETARRLQTLDLHDAIRNNHLVDLAQKAQAGRPDASLWQVTGAGQDDIALYSTDAGELVFAQGCGGAFIKEALTHLAKGGFALNRIEAGESAGACLRTFMTRSGMPARTQTLSIMTLQPRPAQAPWPPDDACIVEAGEFDAAGLDLIARFSLERLGVRRSPQTCRELTESAARRFFGLRQGGRIKAIAALTRSIGRARCLSFVYTSPADRRQGLARQLLTGILAACRNDQDTVFLHVEQDNAPACRLYRALGGMTVASFAVTSHEDAL